MTNIFAIVWKQTGTDDEFDARIPKLMTWLRELHAEGILRGCGGGGWNDESLGGLTLVETTEDRIEAIAIAHPMSDIGTHEIFLWNVFWADLVETQNEERLTKH